MKLRIDRTRASRFWITQPGSLFLENLQKLKRWTLGPENNDGALPVPINGSENGCVEKRKTEGVVWWCGCYGWGGGSFLLSLQQKHNLSTNLSTLILGELRDQPMIILSPGDTQEAIKAVRFADDEKFFPASPSAASRPDAGESEKATSISSIGIS